MRSGQSLHTCRCCWCGIIILANIAIWWCPISEYTLSACRSEINFHSASFLYLYHKYQGDFRCSCAFTTEWVANRYAFSLAKRSCHQSKLGLRSSGRRSWSKLPTGIVIFFGLMSVPGKLLFQQLCLSIRRVDDVVTSSAYSNWYS